MSGSLAPRLSAITEAIPDMPLVIAQIIDASAARLPPAQLINALVAAKPALLQGKRAFHMFHSADELKQREEKRWSQFHSLRLRIGEPPPDLAPVLRLVPVLNEDPEALCFVSHVDYESDVRVIDVVLAVADGMRVGVGHAPDLWPLLSDHRRVTLQHLFESQEPLSGLYKLWLHNIY
jgi:hypothetical protein